MTNVNPNSRAPFTTSEGRLTKYGMDILGDLYRAIGLIAGASELDAIQGQLGDLGLLYQVLAKNKDLTKRLDDIEAQTENVMLMARIRTLEARIEQLENDAQPHFPTLTILQRLDSIEAQL